MQKGHHRAAAATALRNHCPAEGIRDWKGLVLFAQKYVHLYPIMCTSGLKIGFQALLIGGFL